MTETQPQQPNPIDSWALVEMMGHITLAGKVSEETHFGATMMRIDVPETQHEEERTHFIGGQAIFRVTPCSEETAMMWLKNPYRPSVDMAMKKMVPGDIAEDDEGDDGDDGLDEFGQEVD